MKVEVAVPGSRPNKPIVSVDVKQHSTNQKKKKKCFTNQERNVL